jgi:hypothetical protein
MARRQALGKARQEAPCLPGVEWCIGRALSVTEAGGARHERD